LYLYLYLYLYLLVPWGCLAVISLVTDCIVIYRTLNGRNGEVATIKSGSASVPECRCVRLEFPIGASRVLAG
jgi:hypothetical protein